MASIASGSISIFKMASAPVLWTKLTTYDDYALRIVSGSTSTGGSINFSTCFTPVNVTGSITYLGSAGGFTLSPSFLPSHSHYAGWAYSSPFGPNVANGGTPLTASVATTTTPTVPTTSRTSGAAGSGGAHGHTSSPQSAPYTPVNFDMAIKYCDVILAQRN